MIFDGKRRKPLFAVLPVREKHKLVQNEMRLWRAVLDRVFADAFMPFDLKDAEECEAHQEAIKWFENKENFAHVCEIAGLRDAVVERIWKHYREKSLGRGQSTS